MITNKTIKLPEIEIVRFNKACNQIVPEFSNLKDGSIVFEQRVEFPLEQKKFGLNSEIRDEDGAVMDIQVVSCEQDTCYVTATLYINGKLIGRTDGSSELEDTFTLNEYSVTIKKTS